MSAPVLWRVISNSIGAVDTMVLGDTDDDDFRLVLTLVADEADVMRVFPCRVCGWKQECHNGEDCHS